MPDTLSWDIIEKIEKALPKCQVIECAASAAGITHKSMYRWLKRGMVALNANQLTGEPIPAEDEPFAYLAQSVDRMIAEREGDMVDRIRQIGEEGNWQALAWILDKSSPDLWGPDKARIAELERLLEDQRKRLDALTAGAAGGMIAAQVLNGHANGNGFPKLGHNGTNGHVNGHTNGNGRH